MKQQSLGEIIAKAAPLKNLPMLLQPSSAALNINEKGESFLSLYEGELTPEVVTDIMAEIKAAFPSLPKEFFTMLSRRIKDNGFSDERLKDAVRHVIDTCIYPSPTIAQFVGFDRKVRLYTYYEMLKKVDEAGCDSKLWGYYDRKLINGKLFWYSKGDML